MWCYTKKNGTVLYRERYKDPLTGKDKIMSVSKSKDTPQNKNKAQRELNAKIEAAIEKLQCTDNTVPAYNGLQFCRGFAVGSYPVGR